MDYLEYAYLQSGQVKQAKAVLAEMNALPPVAGLTLTGGYPSRRFPPAPRSSSATGNRLAR